MQQDKYMAHKEAHEIGKDRFKPIHMAIDLILKREHNKQLTKDFIRFLLGLWTFKLKERQLKSALRFSLSKTLKPFGSLNKYGNYSVEFITKSIKLLIAQENAESHLMLRFKHVLEAICEDKEIFSIVRKATY